MDHYPHSLSLRRIALWGFIFNLLWEFLQCYFLYDMSGWGFWRITLWMWGAIIGDVLIVLGVVLLAYFIAGKRWIAPPDARGYLVLFIIGLAAAIFLEWLARALNLWEYSDLMPTLTVFGYTVGLSPIIQVTVLPAASVFAAYRHS